MNDLIRVNGFKINPDHIGCLSREEHIGHTGVTIRFTAGGRLWVDDPEAKQIETAYEEWFREQPLPY